jgi:hypothetical protein
MWMNADCDFMNLSRKPNYRSVLKTLPDDYQAALFEYVKTHSRSQILKWLAKDGHKTNPASLSRWRRWYEAKSAFENREAKVITLLASYKRRDPSLTKKAMDDLGDFLFNSLAIERENVKEWTLAQEVKMKRKNQTMEHKKAGLELRKLKEQVESARKTAGDKDLTADEQQARIREILGTE